MEEGHAAENAKFKKKKKSKTVFLSLNVITRDTWCGWLEMETSWSRTEKPFHLEAEPGGEL